MLDRPTYTERAFALAQSGSAGSLKAIRQQLKAEGYSEAGQLSGTSIRGQLIRLIAASKGHTLMPQEPEVEPFG